MQDKGGNENYHIYAVEPTAEPAPIQQRLEALTVDVDQVTAPEPSASTPEATQSP